MLLVKLIVLEIPLDKKLLLIVSWKPARNLGSWLADPSRGIMWAD